MQTDAVRGERREGGGRQKREKAQCFHYAVTSAVRREAPPGRAGRGGEGSRGGSSSPCIPEGRNPHLDYFNLQFFCLNNPIMPLNDQTRGFSPQSSTCAAPGRP